MRGEHIRTDKGKEFTSIKMEEWFKTNKITHYVTQNETKANFAERAINTIKKKLARYMSFQTYRWVDILNGIVHGYNHTYNRSIHMSPADVTNKDINRLWKIQYEPKIKVKKQFKFKNGDLVRISALKRTLEREYDERFTHELFIIVSRGISQGLPIYKLKDYDGKEVTGSFYEQELMKANKIDVYRVEKVLKKKEKIKCWYDGCIGHLNMTPG